MPMCSSFLSVSSFISPSVARPPLASVLFGLLLLLHRIPSSDASSQFAPLSSSPSFSPSLCNPRADSLFLADPTDPRGFFQCRAFAELPSVGVWERHFCPDGMRFAYATQQCAANSLPPEVTGDSNELFRIAILNGSCADGERCIGGTVCDRTERRCLCPYGTVAVLENLYCTALPTTNQLQEETFQWPSQWQRQQMLTNSRNTQLHGQMNGVGRVIPSSASALFVSVAPGSNCFRGELCAGGSVCSPSLGICVCPQGMQNNDGSCEGKTAQNDFSKKDNTEPNILVGLVSLGERCNGSLGGICADQNALCEGGRCRCVVPMVERNGKCQPSTKGPGEKCNRGQKCVEGTKCHPKTALCVCSGETKLKKGRCERKGQTEEAEAEERTTNALSAGKWQAEAGTGATQPPGMVLISSAEGTLPKDSRKKTKASVGGKCSLNADCLNGAYCNGNTQPPICQCLSTHVNVNDKCEKMIYPGQRGCETDLQCSAAYAGTRCLGRQCVCPPGSTPIDKNCIPDGQTNAICTDCTALPNKSWSNELFRRKPNGQFVRHYHQKNPKGSKISMPGELCGPLDTCAGGSSCVEGFCLCPAGTRPSQASGNCESFAQQRKMTKAQAWKESEMNSTAKGESTAPKAIAQGLNAAEQRTNRTPNETTTNVPTAESPKNSPISDPKKTMPTDGSPKKMQTNESYTNVPTAQSHGISPPLTEDPLLRMVNRNLTDNETQSADDKMFGMNVAPNSPQNATEINEEKRAYARPSESCSGGEICTGGSICDRKNKICECPAVKRLLRNHICITSNDLPSIETKAVNPGDLCDSETKCMGNSICAEGVCRCLRGFGLENVHCKDGHADQRESKKNEALPPIQLKLLDEQEDGQRQLEAHPSSPTKRRIRMHAKPRISGPPLRRPPSSPLLAPAGTNGVCPRGNTPLTDQKTGLIIQCNGMTPNCPPKSYCFVTGVASEVYNCCKAY